MDSGTSFVLMPTNSFNKMFSALTTKGFDCTKGELISCKCSSAFPDLNIQIDNTMYKMPSINYVSRIGSSDTCSINVMSIAGSTWILGLNFLHSYYTVFD